MPFDAIYPFQERVAVFIDVLGFSNLITEAERRPDKRDELFSIFTVLDAHVRFDNQNVSAEVPEDAKPRYIFISDSLIFSVPLLPGKYDGLAIAVAKTIQIAHKLLECGYLIQGGVNVGPVWHTASNIFGTGYIQAWRTQETQRHPRVVLTQSARAHWTANLQNLVGGLCLNNDNELIVNTLDPYYLRGAAEIHGGIEQAFLAYRNRILQNLAALPPDQSPYQKWLWFSDFFNSAVQRHGINVPHIQVQ